MKTGSVPIAEVMEWAEDFPTSVFLAEWQRNIENGDADPDEEVNVHVVEEEEIEEAKKGKRVFDTTEGDDYTEDIIQAHEAGKKVYAIWSTGYRYMLGYVIGKK